MLFNFWLVLWHLHLLTLLIVLGGQTRKGIKGMGRTVEDVGWTRKEGKGKGGRGGTVTCIKVIVLNWLGYELIKTHSCISCVVHGACMVPNRKTVRRLNFLWRGRSVRRTLHNGHFGTSAEVSKFLKGAEVSNGHFSTSAEVSVVRSVRTPISKLSL